MDCSAPFSKSARTLRQRTPMLNKPMTVLLGITAAVVGGLAATLGPASPALALAAPLPATAGLIAGRKGMMAVLACAAVVLTLLNVV